MSRWSTIYLGWIGFAVTVVGCGGAPHKEAAHPASGGAAPDNAMVRQGKKEGNFAEAPVGGADLETERKIIHNATLEVIVENFDDRRQELEALIEAKKGYVARSEFTGNIGAKRTGIWAIRVPIPEMPSFVAKVAAMGQPIRHVTDAQDVTAEYVDTRAMLESLREQEKKLNQLMKDKAANLQDFTIWEDKISAVRRDIARLDAQLTRLTRLTAMATVNVTLRDDKEYLPSTNPRYETSIGRTFQASIEALLSFGKWVLLVLTAIAIWLPLIVVGFFVARWGLRVARRNVVAKRGLQ